jgi:hypothetical protein
MDGWHVLAAAVEALVLLTLVLLRYDSLRDRRGATLAGATRSALKWAVVVPVGVVAVLLVPLWVGLILIGLPAIVVGVMALAS